MIFVTFVTLLFRRTSASISYSLKDIFEQVTSVTNVTKITKVTKVTHFFKDKKREVAYLQIRCTPFCYLDHTKPLSKTPIFEQKLRNLLRFSGNSCSSRQGSTTRVVTKTSKDVSHPMMTHSFPRTVN